MCLFEVGLWSVIVASLDNAHLFCFMSPQFSLGAYSITLVLTSHSYVLPIHMKTGFREISFVNSGIFASYTSILL